MDHLQLQLLEPGAVNMFAPSTESSFVTVYGSAGQCPPPTCLLPIPETWVSMGGGRTKKSGQ